jgi:hypothetical protein
VTHQEKVACFEQLLRERGYWISNAIPPACRLLWLLRLQTPPPYFLSFTAGVLTAGIPFGVFWGTFNWLLFWPADKSIGAAIGASAVAATFFGVFMALFWHVQAKKLGLRSWDAFPQSAPAALSAAAVDQSA